MLNGIAAAIYVCAFTLAEVCILFVVLLVFIAEHGFRYHEHWPALLSKFAGPVSLKQ